MHEVCVSFEVFDRKSRIVEQRERKNAMVSFRAIEKDVVEIRITALRCLDVFISPGMSIVSNSADLDTEQANKENDLRTTNLVAQFQVWIPQHRCLLTVKGSSEAVKPMKDFLEMNPIEQSACTKFQNHRVAVTNSEILDRKRNRHATAQESGQRLVTSGLTPKCKKSLASPSGKKSGQETIQSYLASDSRAKRSDDTHKSPFFVQTPARRLYCSPNRVRNLEGQHPQKQQLRQQQKSIFNLNAGEKRNQRMCEAAEEQVTLTQHQLGVIEACCAGRNVFCTGGAGTGKTTLLRELIPRLVARRGIKHVYITATTGLAACAIGGVTVHQFAGISGTISDTLDFNQSNPRARHGVHSKQLQQVRKSFAHFLI